MNEGQGQPGQLDGISLSIIISKNVNPLTNNKVIQINNKNISKNLCFWPWMSRLFKNESQG